MFLSVIKKTFFFFLVACATSPSSPNLQDLACTLDVSVDATHCRLCVGSSACCWVRPWEIYWARPGSCTTSGDPLLCTCRERD